MVSAPAGALCPCTSCNRSMRGPTLLASLAWLCSLACVGGSPVDSRPVARVTVTPRTATVTAPGATVQFAAVALDASGNPMEGTEFLWKSEDLSIATVDHSGLATAKAYGTTTITASARGALGGAVLAVNQHLQLTFLTQPGTAEGQVAFDPTIRVAIQDGFGNTVTDVLADVTIDLYVDPIGAALSGATTVRAVGGIATFSDLSLALPGDGFVLEARSAGVPSAPSERFSVRLTFVQTSAAFFHTCAVTVARFAYCWGWNDRGQLGDGSIATRSTPTPVKGGLHFLQVSAAVYHTCGVTTASDAYCWGTGDNGRLGDGTVNNRFIPTRVKGGLSFVQVSTQNIHTCALTTDHAAYCWGLNDVGQLGDGTTDQRLEPTLVIGGLRLAQISAGGGHTCGVTMDRAARCWGGNSSGRLGDGTTVNRLIPTPVAGGLSFIQVSAGGGFTCGVTPDHAAYCWGFNEEGQLGDGTTTDRFTPTPVQGGVSFVHVTAGGLQRRLLLGLERWRRARRWHHHHATHPHAGAGNSGFR